MIYEYLSMLRDKCLLWQRLETRARCLFLPPYRLKAEFYSSIAFDIFENASIIFHLNVWHVAKCSGGVQSHLTLGEPPYLRCTPLAVSTP